MTPKSESERRYRSLHRKLSPLGIGQLRAARKFRASSWNLMESATVWARQLGILGRISKQTFWREPPTMSYGERVRFSSSWWRIRMAGLRRGGKAIAAVAVVVGGAAGVAYASIPDEGGVIHACYANKDGVLRIIDPEMGATCTSKETPVSWSQAGPAGPPGPSGDSVLFLTARGQEIKPGAQRLPIQGWTNVDSSQSGEMFSPSWPTIATNLRVGAANTSQWFEWPPIEGTFRVELLIDGVASGFGCDFVDESCTSVGSVSIPADSRIVYELGPCVGCTGGREIIASMELHRAT